MTQSQEKPQRYFIGPTYCSLIQFFSKYNN